jgi:mgtE-like transporter
MLHLGLIKPQLRDNTPIYNQLISSVFAITLIDTLAMGVFSFLLNLVTGQAQLAEAYIFFLVPPVACVLAMAVSIPLTSIIGIVTFRRGLDPDILVYPILASINDIMVTIAFIATIYMVVSGGVYLYILASLFVAIVGGIAWICWSNRRISFFIQTIREGTTIVITSILFGSVNGAVLSNISGRLQRTGGLVLYPALTNALGNIGSIIGSTTTTNLALGFTRSLKEEVKSGLKTILQIEAVALLMHIVFAFIAFILQPGINLLYLLVLAILSNISNFSIIAIFALVAAQQSFKRGLNPDNVVIPIITSLADTIATLMLIPIMHFIVLLGII